MSAAIDFSYIMSVRIYFLKLLIPNTTIEVRQILISTIR